MESINDIAIKLSVDAEGVSRGFRTAAEETRAYQKELERLVYAVGKNDPVDYNAHVTQYTQATEARLAKEKKAQEEFNAWYRAEADKEFQAWYAVELKKENVRQQQLAQERQSVINTVNAQNFQAVLEMETAARAQANNDLRAAITARYALLDEEAQLTQNNAANTAELQRLATSQADAAHETELTQLREYIVQKYTALAEADAQEQRQLEMNRVNANRSRERAMADAEEDRERELRQLREAITARYALEDEADRFAPQQQSHVDAFRTNQLREQANAQAEANRIMQQNLTLNERYAQQLANLNRLNTTVITTTGRVALSTRDFTRAKTALTIATIRQQQAQVAANVAMANGYGGAAMAIGQASYAAEDFIQVLSMGGGLNMALMSASNNLSMVARALLGTSGGLSAIAGIGIPAALIGIGFLVRYLMDTEDAAEKAKKALEDFRKETENIGKLTEIRQKFEAESRDIQDMKTREEIQTKINALKQEQKDLDEKMAQEEMKRAGANSAYFEGLMGGQEAVLDFQNRLNKMTLEGTEGQKEAARELSRLYGEARNAAIAGNEQNMLESLRTMHNMMTSNVGGFADYFMSSNQLMDVTALDNLKGKLTDPALLNALQEIYQPNITNMQENMELQQEIAEALLSQDEHMTEERKRQLEIAKKLLEAQHQMFQVEGQITRERQQRMRDDLDALRMTDAEKELKRIRDAQAAFSGIDTTFVGPQLPVSEEAMAQEFMYQQLKLVQDEIAQMNKPVVQSAMEQNGFDAQAQAFDQMLKAKFERDPQTERLDTLITIERAMLQAIEDNAMVRVVN
jgi:hypothetical protein